MIDLLAILPFYLTLAGVAAVDLRFLRALRLFRLFRLLKLARYSSAMASLKQTIYSKREKLLITVYANLLLLIFASSAMYYVEYPHQPNAFSSIPAAFYWGMATLTTVGYGDVTPVTPLGQVLAGVIAFLGIGLFALPASILASGFIEQATEDGTEEESGKDWKHCPHCGEKLE